MTPLAGDTHRLCDPLFRASLQPTDNSRDNAQMDYKIFSIVPESASLALRALWGLMVLGRRRV